MNWLFIGSISGYFLMLGGMHIVIQAALTMSKSVYTGIAIAVFIILLVSFYLAYTDIRYKY